MHTSIFIYRSSSSRSGVGAVQNFLVNREKFLLSGAPAEVGNCAFHSLADVAQFVNGLVRLGLVS